MGHVSEKDDQLTLNFFPNPLGTQSNTRTPVEPFLPLQGKHGSFCLYCKEREKGE